MLVGISPERRTRLVQLAYLILPPKSSRHHRGRVAHAEVEQVLAGAERAADGRSPEAAYALLRSRVVGRALAGGASRGLRVSMPGGEDGAAASRDEALARLTPPARAAYALRHVEGLDAAATLAVLAGLGVPDPATAVKLAEQQGPDPVCLASLEVPVAGVLLRRRRRTVALVALFALAAPAAFLLGSGGDSVPEGSRERTSSTHEVEGRRAAAAKKHGDTSTVAAQNRGSADATRSATRSGSGAAAGSKSGTSKSGASKSGTAKVATAKSGAATSGGSAERAADRAKHAGSVTGTSGTTAAEESAPAAAPGDSTASAPAGAEAADTPAAGAGPASADSTPVVHRGRETERAGRDIDPALDPSTPAPEELGGPR